MGNAYAARDTLMCCARPKQGRSTGGTRRLQQRHCPPRSPGLTARQLAVQVLGGVDACTRQDPKRQQQVKRGPNPVVGRRAGLLRTPSRLVSRLLACNQPPTGQPQSAVGGLRHHGAARHTARGRAGVHPRAHEASSESGRHCDYDAATTGAAGKLGFSSCKIVVCHLSRIERRKRMSLRKSRRSDRAKLRTAAGCRPRAAQEVRARRQLRRWRCLRQAACFNCVETSALLPPVNILKILNST